MNDMISFNEVKPNVIYFSPKLFIVAVLIGDTLITRSALEAHKEFEIDDVNSKVLVDTGLTSNDENKPFPDNVFSRCVDIVVGC